MTSKKISVLEHVIGKVGRDALVSVGFYLKAHNYNGAVGRLAQIYLSL